MQQRVLVAARPDVWHEIEPMLGDTMDLTPAHTTAEAFRVLERGRVDLILSTVGFDESRMIEFLGAVKASAFASIPFLCARVLPGLIRDALVASTRDACKACGAIDLVDVARLTADDAKSTLRAAVRAGRGRPAPTSG
jgi:hypothetical protein